MVGKKYEEVQRYTSATARDFDVSQSTCIQKSQEAVTRMHKLEGELIATNQSVASVVEQQKDFPCSRRHDTAKTRSDPQRGRMSSGDRPIGAAKANNQIPRPCANPPPPHTHRKRAM